MCLVRDAPDVEADVRACCPPPHAVAAFSRQTLVDEKNALSAEGEAAVRAAHSADAVLVEWALEAAPALNAFAFRVRRAARAPVLMLCEGDGEARAACLAAGADDVLTLPFHPLYLQAKVLAYRRLVEAARAAGAPPPDVRPGDAQAATTRYFGELRLDGTAHRFFVRDEEVALTPREFTLLQFLLDHAGALCTREQILDRVWGLNFDTGTNMVDVYMYFLRRKLEAYGLKGMIQTVRGRGYRLALP